MTSLSESQTHSESRQLSNEVSIYTGPLTPKVIFECVAKAKTAFPALTADFFEILSQRIRENGFTDDRLRDAVAHVIDTCPYPTPTIANFISFDRTFKVLTYDQMLKYNDEHPGVWELYKPVKFPDRKNPVFVHQDDVEKYNLTPIE